MLANAQAGGMRIAATRASNSFFQACAASRVKKVRQSAVSIVVGIGAVAVCCRGAARTSDAAEAPVLMCDYAAWLGGRLVATMIEELPQRRTERIVCVPCVGHVRPDDEVNSRRVGSCSHEVSAPLIAYDAAHAIVKQLRVGSQVAFC